MKPANDMLPEILRSRDHDIAKLQEALRKERAEIERLRAAFKQISAIASSTPARIGAPHPASVSLTKVHDIALAALNHEQPPRTSIINPRNVPASAAWGEVMERDDEQGDKAT